MASTSYQRMAKRSGTSTPVGSGVLHAQAPVLPQGSDVAVASPSDRRDFERVPIQIHPRVFSALGADLVTDDLVAVIELVKNAYDAFAQNVRLRFGKDESGGSFFEIKDDGTGMTRQVIEKVWCCVATPYRNVNRVSKRDGKIRRVVGEKGLGRLAVARLGSHLRMLTQAAGAPCWEVTVDWAAVQQADELSQSFVRCREFRQLSPFQESGTCLRVSDLNGQWDQARIEDLKENLARLISPFFGVDDFNILLETPSAAESEEVQIEAPAFLTKPKYSVRGTVDDEGNVSGHYRFAPLGVNGGREKKLKLSWERIFDGIQDRTRFPYSSDASHCGPFSFEIRAWDVNSDGTQEIAHRFDFQKSKVRKAIRAHKGISVYRDGVLVLPKSESARDWFGLDLRRVSKVGTRLSTSQIVGYVSITAAENSGIKDTSDRERLVSSPEVAEFIEILKAVVGFLENERDSDRSKEDRRKPSTRLIEGMSADALVKEVVQLSERGASARDVMPVLRNFKESLDSDRRLIENRFIYYSRLATVGTIAHLLVHEIRNRTTVYGSFLEFVKDRFSPFHEPGMEATFRRADNAIDALERLADTFSPLASRNFRRRKRYSNLEERIQACLSLLAGEISRKGVRCSVPDTETTVAVDPGELDAIILNLVSNSIYWMGEVPRDDRMLSFEVTQGSGGGDRVRVSVTDQGPGIDQEDLEKVFWPGMTRKPGGIGMGLTVASELVASYGGRMAAEVRNPHTGARFIFDLPSRKPMD